MHSFSGSHHPVNKFTPPQNLSFPTPLNIISLLILAFLIADLTCFSGRYCKTPSWYRCIFRILPNIYDEAFCQNSQRLLAHLRRLTGFWTRLCDKRSLQSIIKHRRNELIRTKVHSQVNNQVLILCTFLIATKKWGGPPT